jgi:branched-chain amino acid transport system substrate-binding protein
MSVPARRCHPYLYGVVVAAVLALAACSSNGSGTTGQAASTAKTPTGTPIKTMTIEAVNCSSCLSLPNSAQTVTLFEKWINEHGGIDGHPLQAEVCDDQGLPSGSAACARKAAADGDVAVVGDYNLNDAAIVPVLAAEGIDDFADLNASVEVAASSPDVQALSSYVSAVYVKAIADGCKKITTLTVDLGSASDAFESNSAKLAFESMNALSLWQAAKVVYVPLSAQDLAPQMTQALSGGTDCLVSTLGPSSAQQVLSAYASLGGTARIYSVVGAGIEAAAQDGFTKQTDGSIVYGAYSGFDTAPYAEFRSAIAQFNPPKNLNFDSSATLGAWAAYTGFANLVKSMKGSVTATTFRAAAQQATVCTDGMLPCIDFAQPSVLGSAFKNWNDYQVTFFTVENGQDVPFDNGKFFDLQNTLTGASLPAADVPSATPMSS